MRLWRAATSKHSWRWQQATTNSSGLLASVATHQHRCLASRVGASNATSVDDERKQPRHEFVEVEVRGSGVVYVRLNRSDLHNAFNEQVITELTDVFQSFAKPSDDSPRVVVISGEGKSFSAGADLNWMKKMATYSEEENLVDAKRLFQMFSAIKTCPVPVIARVNGAALGGGAGIVAACDFSLAVSTAKFGFTEVKVGIIPAVISPFVMEKIGAHSSRYFLTGEVFSSDEALRIGLIQKHFPTLAELDESLKSILQSTTLGSPNAIAACKRLIARVSSVGAANRAALHDYITGEIARIRVSSEGQAGLNSFLTKTSPPWVHT